MHTQNMSHLSPIGNQPAPAYEHSVAKDENSGVIGDRAYKDAGEIFSSLDYSDQNYYVTSFLERLIQLRSNNTRDARDMATYFKENDNNLANILNEFWKTTAEPATR